MVLVSWANAGVGVHRIFKILNVMILQIIASVIKINSTIIQLNQYSFNGKYFQLTQPQLE